jgi:hypothetical protein
MFGIVAPDDDKLALLVEIENIDNVQTPGAIARAWRANAAAENQSYDIDKQEGGEQERHDGSQHGEQLRKFIRHELGFSRYLRK